MTAPELLSAFTPSTMQPATLEAMFVKREPLVQRILESITAAARGEGIEHHIAVGPRGIGKTHLLSLITYRLLRDPMFLDRAVVAWLREEEWGISSVGELYETILKQLASDETPILAVHTAATAAVEQLAGASLADLTDEAEHLLTEVLDDRKVVVVVENLDLLFATMGKDDQHRLRAYLQNEQNLVLLASTPSLSESISLRKGLFFGFFAIHWLDELDVDEARELLERIAVLRDDDEGRKLTAYLATDEATRRLQTVQALAGGHPRLWVLMAECITTERLEEVVGLLLAVLDDLTPYYQSQMAALSPQQRKIVMVLSRTEGAIPPKEIAARARIQEKVAAKQLGDLTKLGYVRIAELPDGVKVKDKRIRPYELREPLLRHVLEVKESRGKPLRLVVEFLRAWYDRPRLEQWADGHQPTAASYAKAALLDLAGDRVGPAPRDGDSIEAAIALTRDHPEDVTAFLGLGNAHVRERRFDRALEAFQRSLQITPDSAEAMNGLNVALAGLGRHEEALEWIEQALLLDPSHPVLRYNLGVTLDDLGRIDHAIGVYQQIIDDGDAFAKVFNNLALDLNHRGHHQEALLTIRRATALDPGDAGALANEILFRLDVDGDLLPSIAELTEILGRAPDDGFRVRNLQWLAERIRQNTPPLRWASALADLADACSTTAFDSDLTAALIRNLERDQPSTAWLRAIVEGVGAVMPDAPLVQVGRAVTTYAETRDGELLLRLPSELRRTACEIAGFDPRTVDEE